MILTFGLLPNTCESEFEARPGYHRRFAEDRRSAEGVFFNYYVFERKDDTRYLIVRAPVRVDDPKFPSLSPNCQP